MSQPLKGNVARQRPRCQDEIHWCEDVSLVVAISKGHGFGTRFRCNAGLEMPSETRTFEFVGIPHHEGFVQMGPDH